MMVRETTDGDVRYVQAWGLVPPDLTASRPEQAAAIFGEIERVLAEYGLTFANVVRTWFYCDRINEWYADFNAARTAYFTRTGVFGRYLPASTGIGHGNPFGAALTAGFVAMTPFRAVAVKSPLQADAMSYRSSFSRAAEATGTHERRLYVSGTASILPNSSEVAHVGDIDRQIDCAMNAVLAIVESRGMTVADVTRAIVYLKSAESLPAWRAYLTRHPERAAFGTLATVLVADVCRPDWLFEVELDAQGDKLKR